MTLNFDHAWDRLSLTGP